MATVVFMRQTRQAGLTGFFNDDPVSMVGDGQEVGSKVDPDTNPASIFQIVDVPGVPIIDISFSLETAHGPETGPPGEETRALTHKRRYKMNVNNLPIPQRPQYGLGNRISVTEAEYLAAVLEKPGAP